MKRVFVALVLTCSLTSLAYAAEPPAEKIELEDGSTLYLHPDGTGRMMDAHGKKIEMRDGVEMETADGKTIVMMNKKVWVQYGGPRGGPPVLKTE